MSEERHPKEIAELLRFRCAISAMDPRDRELLIGAADALDDYASLLARHNALCDAVAWERETDECGEWLHIAWWDNPKIDLLDIWDIHHAARAEVDRLIGEGKWAR